MKIAIAGKGGVGKTVLASSIAWALARAGYTTLAIDADEAPNLALSLGLTRWEAAEIRPVLENEELIRSKTGTDYAGVYNLNFTVDDVVRDFSVRTPAGVHLLVMGTVKAAGSGCACPANSLLQALLRHLVVERDEAVVLDLEAGVEHLGRKTAESVDCMLVVSDVNQKSLLTARAIARLARETGIPKVRLVGNRVENGAQHEIIRAFAREEELPLLGIVPYDSAVVQAGILGSSTLTLRDSCAARAIDKLTGLLIQASETSETKAVQEGGKA
ncbi:ATP-binding protein [Methanocella arvoryzae]|uniref:Carbon monoxide dehydrogenase maturation factor (Accessory nickel-insertion protein) n=1 Tax=Methanocella arvoryzae (strain DSM 22066 / NBRC 105507 / MRE50) TaxID=351160 RepID=Q0W877_METAR|nr:ArsA-related P-loop ATPase [Methanocella arvoryzae]CAJ35416.1 putative carbon monoxide dehydrogenase maturation factor (accessory nickel-insertion protein) [Methanocella arvoryzae MRE50]